MRAAKAKYEAPLDLACVRVAPDRREESERAFVGPAANRSVYASHLPLGLGAPTADALTLQSCRSAQLASPMERATRTKAELAQSSNGRPVSLAGLPAGASWPNRQLYN